MYASVEDLRAAFDRVTFLSLFDDDGVGEVADASASIQQVLGSAHAEVTSHLAIIYGDSLPSSLPEGVPTILKIAEIEFARCFAYERRPSVAASLPEGFLDRIWKRAKGRMDDLKSARTRIAATDNPPPVAPANVGGLVYDVGPRVTINDPDGRSNLGDF